MRKAVVFTVFTVLAVLVGIVASADSGVNSSIWGSWKVPTISQGGFTFDVTFKFEANKVTVTNQCSADGSVSSVQASVGAVIDDHSVTTTSEKHAKNGACTIDIAQGTMNYAVSADGNSLTLTSAGQAPAVLTRLP